MILSLLLACSAPEATWRYEAADPVEDDGGSGGGGEEDWGEESEAIWWGDMAPDYAGESGVEIVEDGEVLCEYFGAFQGEPIAACDGCDGGVRFVIEDIEIEEDDDCWDVPPQEVEGAELQLGWAGDDLFFFEEGEWWELPGHTELDEGWREWWVEL